MSDLAEDLLRQKRDELEVLRAMFPGPGELHIDNSIDSNVYLQLKMTIGSATAELSAELNQDYPIAPPDVFVRSDSLHRTVQRQLNDSLNEYVESVDRGEPCIYTIVTWLQDNAERYFTAKIEQVKKEKSTIKQYGRLWILSHHIYNKSKRNDILSLAGQFDLTGFMLAGKPGIVCVEGDLSACEEWWSYIKGLNWKKIGVKKKEETPRSEIFDRKFERFEEISFQSGNSHHMDMGKFYKYLEEHNCSYMFMEYFGVNGRT